MRFGTLTRKCTICEHTTRKGCACSNPNQNCPVCNHFNFFCMSRTQTVQHIIKCLDTIRGKGIA